MVASIQVDLRFMVIKVLNIKKIKTKAKKNIYFTNCLTKNVHVYFIFHFMPMDPFKCDTLGLGYLSYGFYDDKLDKLDLWVLDRC